MRIIKNVIPIFFILLLQNAIHARQGESSFDNLMPKPQKIAVKEGTHRIDDAFSVSVSGNPNVRLHQNISRMISRLAGRTGFFLPQTFFDPKQEIAEPNLYINVERPGEIRFGEDESCTLTITPRQIELKAKTDLGAMHGLETLLQLLDTDEQGYFFPALEIQDKPRFPWRGLMVDSCRHFMPVEVIKRNLDGMAVVKLNVLHWHLSEDQGFRVECKSFPKLHELGSDGLYYTQDQIWDVIKYAADPGIRVMPEFDLPGHATSWLVAYPELASAPGPYQIERAWGVFDPTINPAIEQTYKFLAVFFKEMAALFPDEYMHIGGDENNGKQWDANPQIQQFMQENDIADNHELQSYFNNRLLKILTDNNKKMVGWDEILHPQMPTNIVIQSWRGREAMIEAAKQGYQTLLSNGYYIDLIQPADFHYLNDPAPADLPLTEEQRSFILGGEATMWAEMISPETIDSRIWPRTAAIAERFWSPATVCDVDDMYRRMNIVSFRLEELGLLHEKNYAMMLRRLTNNQDTDPLKSLIDVIEPVKIYSRNRLRKHFSYTPLTRVVDAARPDAQTARDFRKLVDTYLSGGGDNHLAEKKIFHWLNLWKDNHPKLKPIIEKSPILWDIEAHSENLSDLAAIGLDALNAIINKETIENEWEKQSNNIIEQAKTQHGQTEIMIIPAIKKLLEATNSD